jgi:hypothetical protein
MVPARPLVENDRIVEIQHYDDRESAAGAAGWDG